MLRLLGVAPASAPALPQTGTEVLPTRTICTFAGEGIGLSVTFMTPALPDDIDLLSRPVTYVTWDVVATDGKTHDVSVYFDASAAIAVNDARTQKVVCARERIPGLDVLRAGTEDQRVLARYGDGVRIDWGYFYLAAPLDQNSTSALAPAEQARQAFSETGKLALADDAGPARTVAAGAPVLAYAFDCGSVSATPVQRWAILAYDQIYSTSYFFSYLRPYWRRNGAEADDLLKTCATDYPTLLKRCTGFDDELMGDLVKAGGESYAKLAALSYRQAWAGNVICADANKRPLMFSKENTSNGSMATVDVFYPFAPLPLLFSPTLMKAMLIPELDYGGSHFWTAPYAPHDMGCYPRAYVPNYGDMPVEESGNMLILTASVAKMEGNAGFADKYWPLLQKWARYLKEKGFDPEHQLCTDDFTGPLAHQTNLSIKAITALGAWGYLCNLHGDKAEAAEYSTLAKDLAARWVQEAADGDHYRLAFDKPNTWGQKYNLVWDQVLGLGLFPDAVRKQELAFYQTKLNPHGLPLDYRKDLTKTDWTAWVACFAQHNAQFSPFIVAINRYLSETDQRVPLTDFYDTIDINKRPGFHARPVMGAVFMRMLQDDAVWKKWTSRDTTSTGSWAPLPDYQVVPVVAAGDTAEAIWSFTHDKPADDWAQPGFDASAWKTGLAGFGNREALRGKLRTQDWPGEGIWLRREFDLPTLPDPKTLRVWCRHEGEVQVFINGVLAMIDYKGLCGYYAMPLTNEALAALRSGKNTLAVYAFRPDERDGKAPQRFVDVGLVALH